MFERVTQGPLAGELVRLEIPVTSCICRPMQWQKAGLTYTASGYGEKIPTQYMVRTIDQKWRRVYCRIFSNVGTLYVMHGKEKTIVELLGVTE